jgi:hypothetical protein
MAAAYTLIREGQWTSNICEACALGSDPPAPFDDCGPNHQDRPEEITDEDAPPRVGID